MSPRALIDWTLQNSGWGTLAELEEKKWIDCQPEFDTAHYVGGFGYADKKFKFAGLAAHPAGRSFDWFSADMPGLPDHWDVIERRTPSILSGSPPSPARLPKLVLQRNADQPRQGRAAAGQDASR
jgi:hypothetical protein